MVSSAQPVDDRVDFGGVDPADLLSTGQSVRDAPIGELRPQASPVAARVTVDGRGINSRAPDPRAMKADRHPWRDLHGQTQPDQHPATWCILWGLSTRPRGRKPGLRESMGCRSRCSGCAAGAVYTALGIPGRRCTGTSTLPPPATRAEQCPAGTTWVVLAFVSSLQVACLADRTGGNCSSGPAAVGTGRKGVPPSAHASPRPYVASTPPMRRPLE